MSEAATRAPLTREQVVSAAREMIRTEGLEALSLRRIGKVLGVTAPALYAYVEDKRDLLRGVAEQEFAALLERFDAITETDPRERLRALSRVYLGYASESPELFRTMFLFPPELSFTGATGEELPSATNVFGFASEAISEAAKAGVVRSDIDPVVATFVSWVSIHGLATVLNLGFALDDATREMLIEVTLEANLRGLAP